MPRRWTGQLVAATHVLVAIVIAYGWLRILWYSVAYATTPASCAPDGWCEGNGLAGLFALASLVLLAALLVLVPWWFGLVRIVPRHADRPGRGVVLFLVITDVPCVLGAGSFARANPNLPDEVAAWAWSVVFLAALGLVAMVAASLTARFGTRGVTPPAGTP